jgi:uroporphyrinogen-III synthase
MFAFLKSNFASLTRLLSPFSTWRFFSREQEKGECDWLMMTSLFVVSQSSCFFLCSREQICLVESRL